MASGFASSKGTTLPTKQRLFPDPEEVDICCISLLTPR